MQCVVPAEVVMHCSPVRMLNFTVLDVAVEHGVWVSLEAHTRKRHFGRVIVSIVVSPLHLRTECDVARHTTIH
jgi:hypothetical protein